MASKPQSRSESIRDARYIYLQSSPWTPLQECLAAVCDAYDSLEEQLEAAQATNNVLKMEATAREGGWSRAQELHEQLEAYEKALKGIILCSTISHAWAVAQEALGDGSNPASGCTCIDDECCDDCSPRPLEKTVSDQTSYSLEELEEEFLVELYKPLPLYKRIKYATIRKIRAVRIVPRRIKWFWQRGQRGYSDADTWGFDWYLSSVILGGVGAIRERAMGYPAGLTWEEWEQILLKIEAGFEAAKVIQNGDWFDEGRVKYDEQMVIFDDGMNLLREHYFHLWD